MKSKIKYFKKPHLKNPYLVAAWPGMGSVAIRAVEFLWEKLKPKEFAEINPEGFFYLQEAWIIDGQVESSRLPQGKFYYWINNSGKHDLIIFLCETQPSLEKGHSYAELVMDVACLFKVKRIFTFAAMPMPIDHSQQSKVWVAMTNKKLLKEISTMDIKTMHTGQISGLNGLLLSVAKERQVDGFCFLGEIPLYAIQIENPRASQMVLSIFAKLMGIELDFTSLMERAKIIEDEIEKLIDYFKTGTPPGPINDEDIEKIKKTLASYTKLPESARTKIEELFRSAENDLSKAHELKEELDKWNIYREYEDRFLDLFKPHKKDNN